MVKAVLYFVIGSILIIWASINLFAVFSLSFQSNDVAISAGALFGSSVWQLIILLFGIAFVINGKLKISDVKSEKNGTDEAFKNITG